MSGAEPCPLCGAALQPWFRKQGRSYVRCPECRFIAVAEGLLLDASGATVYETQQNVFSEGGNEDYYFDESNMRSVRQKLAWVRKFAPDGQRLLDVGANFGHFLKAAAAVYPAVGLELSPQAAAWSREHFGVDNRVASLYDPPGDLGAPFDIVTCWDVIEHVPDGAGAVASLKALTRPGGTLFISTPDAQSMAARLTGRRWHYLDPVQHVSLFGRKNLAGLLEKGGFRVVGVRSFGHYYRVRYIAQRLQQLHQEGWQRFAARAAGAVLTPFGRCMVYLKLGDVLGIAARREGS